MRVAELWRYPVKSLAGERLDAVDVLSMGVPGDRIVQVYDARGRIVTSRTTPALLGLRGTTSADGEPLINGELWTAPSVSKVIEAIAGPGARLVRDDGPNRFDVLPLLVATDGAIDALGLDRRRFRPTSSWPASRGSPSASGPGVVRASVTRSSPSRSSAADAS